MSNDKTKRISFRCTDEFYKRFKRFAGPHDNVQDALEELMEDADVDVGVKSGRSRSRMWDN